MIFALLKPARKFQFKLLIIPNQNEQVNFKNYTENQSVK